MNALNKQSLTQSQKNNMFIKNMIESATPGQLVTILYDGAVQWLQMSKKELEKNKGSLPNWSDYSHQINMAIKILDHLQDSLDTTTGEEFIEKLFALYNFFKDKLIHASCYKTEEDIDLVIKFIKDLRNNWVEALKLQKTKSSSTIGSCA